jgi:hypothetical protein
MAYFIYLETVSCNIHRFQFNNVPAIHLKTKLDIGSTQERATWKVLKCGAEVG